MTAVILDGKAAAAEIKRELAARVEALKEGGIEPGLGTVLVGDDPGSRSYVAGKHRDCRRSGSPRSAVDLPADATQARGRGGRARAERGPGVHRVHRPAAAAARAGRQAGAHLMDPAKDADGLHPVNLGRLVLNEDARCPAPRTAYRAAA